MTPRIAQLANFVGPASGGMRTAIEHLGLGYCAAGAERILITPGERDSVTESEAGTVVRLRAPKVSGGYRMIAQPWRVTEILERFGPTTVEISDKSTLLPVARWARRGGIGAVLFSHERLDAMLSLRTGRRLGVAAGVGALYRLLGKTYDAIVVTSRYAAEEFTEVATPLARIPLGVDLDTFRPLPAAPKPDGVLKLVHAGRLSREKSPHLAVATAVELHRRGVPVRLDVYGSGPHLGELLAIAGDAPVVFHGHVDGRRTLARHLAEADIALSVCPGETFGLAVLEALACGTPVVTADTGGARELVDPACGRWAPARPDLLADAVLRLTRVPGSRVAARRRAEQYDWQTCVDRMLALHHRLARPRGNTRRASRFRGIVASRSGAPASKSGGHEERGGRASRGRPGKSGPVRAGRQRLQG
jgi:alpha-1,6-mannosyltransferase